MVRLYKDGKIGHTLKEVAALLHTRKEGVLKLIGEGKLEYFQHTLNSPQYVSDDSLRIYMRTHEEQLWAKDPKRKPPKS